MNSQLSEEFNVEFMKYLFSSINGVGPTKSEMIIGHIDSVSSFLSQNEESLKTYYTASEKRIIEDNKIHLFINARDELKDMIEKFDLKNDINKIWITYLIRDFIVTQIKNINNLKLEDIDLNPHLIFLMGLKDREVFDFFVTQTISRSIVTSWGMNVEKFLKYSGCLSNINIKDILIDSIGISKFNELKGSKADLIKIKDNQLYLIQVKSGPNTMNVEMVEGLNKAMNIMESSNIEKINQYLSAQGYNEIKSVISILGMTYGNRSKISTQIKSNLTNFDTKVKIGHELWDFISEEKDYSNVLLNIIDKASQFFTPASNNLSKIITEKVDEIYKTWQEKYEEQNIHDILKKYYL